MSQDLQDQPEEPGWLSILRRKAKLYDQELPRLAADLALTKANVDEEHSSYGIWRESYERRVRDGETQWDAAAVAEDAARYDLIRPEPYDFSADAATQARMEAVSSGAVGVDPKAAARDRMHSARSIEEFVASYRAQGGVVVEE
jgi:hypothetical protein